MINHDRLYTVITIGSTNIGLCQERDTESMVKSGIKTLVFCLFLIKH